MSSDRFNRQFILLDFRDLENPDYLSFVRSPEFSTYLLMRRHIWRSRKPHHMGLESLYMSGYLACSLDRERISEQLGGISTRTISNDLAQLERREVIEVQHTGRQNIYLLGRWGNDEGAYYETWYVDRLHVREEENFLSDVQDEPLPVRVEENFLSDEKAQKERMREEDFFSSERTKRFISEEQLIASKNREGKREQKREEFENSKDSVLRISEDRAVIASYIEDFAREFKDEAPLSSSVTRVMNLYINSELKLDEFTAVLMSARTTTQRRTSAIQKTSSRPGAISTKNKMPYFLKVVETLVGTNIENDISQRETRSAD